MSQLFNLLENHFFLNISINLKMSAENTKFHIKDMHQNILNSKKTLNDYSIELQNAYFKYLEFLDIKY